MKKVKLSSCVVVNKDEKGKITLVGKAKEAINAMAKKKIQIDIWIDDKETKKDDLKTFLEDNNVSVTNIFMAPEKPPKEEYDVIVLGGDKILIHQNDWKWTLSEIVDRIYGPKKKEEHYSEQKKMDDAMDDYISWAQKAAKSISNH